MDLETLLWNRILELAKSNLKQSAFEYFVSDAHLDSIADKIITIHLSSHVKQLFWQQNLTDIVIVAGWEIYHEELNVHFQVTPIITEKSPTTEEILTDQTTTKKTSLQNKSFTTSIKPQYTFDNFVQGTNNAMSKAAALAVSDNPGELYNPLFIHGGPGLGKTHLLNAIGNQIMSYNPDAKIKLVSSENFLNEFVEHTRLNKMEAFKNTYRQLDVLLIDDIQSLKNKKATQEEFFNTFNALYDNKKQIVLTSDRTPNQLDNLPERLVTRFSWGLISEITPPDYETRVAILKNKCDAYPFFFTEDTLAYLAGQFHSNVRDLEGALKDINLLATMKQVTEITVDLAAEAIRSRQEEKATHKIIAIETIQKEVGKFYGINVVELKGKKRLQAIVHARHVAMYLSHILTDNSSSKIASEFGRDHSTVLHALNKIEKELEENDNLEIELTSIRNHIESVDN